MKKAAPHESPSLHVVETHFAHRSLTYKGMTIHYVLNFFEGTMSLVKDDGSDKRFFFNDRGLCYMDTWLDILEAMKIAVQNGQAELQENQDKEEASEEKEMEEVGNFLSNAFEAIRKGKNK